MKLCSNRPEGFGPSSHLYSHILTSCFLDTILVPLCTWVYLLTLAILASVCASRRRSSSPTYTIDGFTSKQGKSKIRIGFTGLYYFIIIAEIAMCSLEIARLIKADLGIGLLPFTFVSLLVAAILRVTSWPEKKITYWSWVNVGLWVALAATNSVKLAEQVKEGLHTRKGSQYPESDEFIDVTVMVALYVVLALLDALLGPTSALN